jgi:RHS repeat-associated protein
LRSIVKRLRRNSDADHLNTPRLVADATGTTVWRWDQTEPFGNKPADEDPDANSVAFDLPLRLAGQRYDAETGLHYNYFRDYDPSLGRYGESDPIGLRGGLNTYAYVYGNPTRYADSLGLDAEMCTRPFYPFPVPVARHCYIRFNKNDNDTSTYDTSGGGHSDPAPSWWPKSCVPTKGEQDDDCLKREMKKCEASQFDILSTNCCRCTEQAMKRCGMWIPQKDWPNWPINPGPQPGEPGYKP